MIRTDRGDEVRARYLIMAVGILNLMKLPVIPGMDEFEGKAFHTARWDYDYTGGSQDDPRLTKLADKVVGVVGVGASGIQAVPPLAESAKHVYVFQRTPSAIGERGNRPTDDDFAEQLRPGWQKERMENFSGVMIGRPVERDLVDDGWTLHTARVNNPVVEAGHDGRRHRGPGRSVRLRRDGGAPERASTRSSAIPPSQRCSSRTTATGASGRASTTSTCRRSTTPT